MTTRTFTTKSGTVFEWEETSEVLKALKELHDEIKTNTQTTTVD
jgi:hypothetical protein